jgi:site-specific DNA-methyltransferase (cytosine-N4-specific)
MTSDCEILIGDVRAKLCELKARGVKVRCVVTSPPYWGLRDYGTVPQVWGGRVDCEHTWGPGDTRHRGGPQGATGDRATRDTAAQDATGDVSTGRFCMNCHAWIGELGLEPTPELFVVHIVEVFALVRDVLANDGTCWVNMGDCYATGAAGLTNRGDSRPGFDGKGQTQASAYGKGYRGGRGKSMGKHGYRDDVVQPNRLPLPGIKPKDLVGQPWMIAFALRAAGWWLRSDIIWHKPNPMPESIRDRPTKSHEYIFLLTKSARYYYDAEAIKEPVTGLAHARSVAASEFPAAALRHGEARRRNGVNPKALPRMAGWQTRQNASFSEAVSGLVTMRNKRTVWSVPTEPYPEAHYATFPTQLIVPCILAGTKPGDTVLDPFGGSGTTGQVATSLGRRAILIDLDPANEARMRGRLLRRLNVKGKRKVRQHHRQLELLSA